MKKHTLYILFTILFGAAIFSSCKDDLLYDPSYIGEGEATLISSVSFHPLVTALDETSRSSGDAIKNIENLQIVMYKSDGTFFRSVKITEEEHGMVIHKGQNTNMPESSVDGSYNKPNGNHIQAEERTDSVTFSLSGIPFGKYRIYAVANYDKILDETNAKTEKDLKNITVDWQTDISKNKQMFGCFSTHPTMDFDDEAPEVIINRGAMTLHSWVKRLASKLTVVFDGSGLHQGIFVYINKVTIHDIPSSCSFGSPRDTVAAENMIYRGNRPDAESLIHDGETLYYKPDGSVSTESNLDATDRNSAAANWMTVTKDNKALGAVQMIDGKPVPHHETCEAMYFYENAQGDYSKHPNKFPAYYKPQIADSVGHNINEEHPDWKDNVRNGTYIEVEGYYYSNGETDGYVSYGPIKYRFMLGLDTEYNYDALRNRHYKLTLGFRGYANQPDWHIVYNEITPGQYPPERFYVSYMYNVRHEMPIRLTGKPIRVTAQIMENNWAPYDMTKEGQEHPVPDADPVGGTDPMRFQWYRDVYMQTTEQSDGVRKNLKPTGSLSNLTGFYYGIHAISDYYGMNHSKLDYYYKPTAKTGLNRKVTPIWVGFLALQQPKIYDNLSKKLPTGISDRPTDDYTDLSNTVGDMRKYYMGTGGNDTEGGTNTTTPMYQCMYDLSKINITDDYQGVAPVNKSGAPMSSNNGRNAARVKKNVDDSYTINIPLYTMPKTIGRISGFSGNNPYESYRRRAVVRIISEYDMGDGTTDTLMNDVPVYQMRRIVNPKAVWRTTDKNAEGKTDPFHVKLMVLDKPGDTKFTQLTSEGEWTAWIATPGDEDTPLESSSFSLSGGSRDGGKIHGDTGSPIEFDINFANIDENSVECGKVIVKYHGNVCEHAIYLRHGYRQALDVAGNGTRWSSYNVYSFDGPDLEDVTKLPANTLDGLKAIMTVNPLALGTFFKRANYGQGIRISNNETYKPLDPVTGAMELVRKKNDSNENDFSRSANWSKIKGLRAATNTTWSWSSFKSDVYGKTRKYDVPKLEDYQTLIGLDFGIITVR